MKNPLNDLFMIYEKLKNHLPEKVFLQIPKICVEYQINTELRISHFLGQCAHESATFTLVEENLNYSKEALMSVFRRHFPTESLASQYARKPQMIANKAYGNRMGNGDEESGDGWKYRGRGYIQLTGKFNYSQFNGFVEEDIINNPNLVATKYPLVSAAWFWNRHKLNYIADEGSTDEVVRKITKIINGGYNGLNDRIRKFKKYYTYINNKEN